MLGYFPKIIAQKSVQCYIITLLIVTMLFFQHSLSLYLFVFGIASVVGFFYGSFSLSKKWINLTPKSYEKKLFKVAFVIRLVYVILIYFLNYELYGTFHESNGGDIGFYMDTPLHAVSLVGEYNIIELWHSWDIQYDDMGYMLYLLCLYLFISDISTVIIPLVIKALLGALTCVFISRMATNHFGRNVGYMTGIFCALQFNMIWWCGSMMKETEMLFILVSFLTSMDDIITKNNFAVQRIVFLTLIGLLLFLFRTVLGLVAFAAILITLIMGSNRLRSASKRFLTIGLVTGVLIFVMADTFSEQIQDTLTASEDSYQEKNMEWRSKREGGNAFAKYAGAAVFAPLIFTIPFPTMVYTQLGQEMQMQAHGGYFIKNVLSFFVIFVMFYLLKTKQWKHHLLPITFMCGYLAALVLSVFAQSGRFHLMIIPFEMMFAAYGVSLLNKKGIKWFQYALIFECVVCIAWSWFKLAGRGLA